MICWSSKTTNKNGSKIRTPDFFKDLSIDKFQSYKYLFDQFLVYWFPAYSIHPMFVSFLEISVFRLPRDADNHGLWKTLRFQKSSYLKCWVTSVENWHVLVHENEMVVAEFTFVTFNVLFNFLESSLAIHSLRADFFCTLNAKIWFKEHFERFNVKNLVIDDQNLLIVYQRAHRACYWDIFSFDLHWFTLFFDVFVVLELFLTFIKEESITLFYFIITLIDSQVHIIDVFHTWVPFKLKIICITCIHHLIINVIHRRNLQFKIKNTTNSRLWVNSNDPIKLVNKLLCDHKS